VIDICTSSGILVRVFWAGMEVARDCLSVCYIYKLSTDRFMVIVILSVCANQISASLPQLISPHPRYHQHVSPRESLAGYFTNNVDVEHVLA